MAADDAMTKPMLSINSWIMIAMDYL